MSDDYVETNSILDEILANKVEELRLQKAKTPLKTVQLLASRVSKPRDFLGALRRDTVALIAEIKKASPSKGVLIEAFDPIALARTFAANGAAALSVLTDETYFQGHLQYLEEADKAVEIPTLRKDFIIDPYQVYEARMARADAVLLIVAALSDSQLRDLHDLTAELRMVALVEVHNEPEMERALTLGAKLIGINNRDLQTFGVDLNTVQRLAQLVPETVTLVAESGMKSTDDVARMGAVGAHAVLIGEGLVTAGDMAAAVREFSSQSRG